MKLAVFGAATVILGLALGVDGLALAGLVWICCGIAVRLLQGLSLIHISEPTRPY